MHLGAHKTATTHFQKVLEVNRCLHPSNISYIEMEQFRSNLRWKNGRVDVTSCGAYLDEIKRSCSTLVISEENLSGEAKDIYKNLFLYSDIENRLSSLGEFTQDFDEIEVWFSIRSMDGFLPSIYCESLKHWRYRKFDKVYAGNYSQTWLPVIKSIRRVFPKARINVIRYENYKSALPLVIKKIFGKSENWDTLEGSRPRESMNHYACNLMPPGMKFIPAKISSRTLQGISNLLNDNNLGYKFAPFNQQQVDGLLDVYTKDINVIKKMKQVFLY